MTPATERPAITPETLRRLAFDQSIRWTSQNDDLWQLIDNDLWQLTRNPSLILSTVPEQRLEALLQRAECHRLVEGIVEAQQARLERPTWFASQHYGETLARVAYFSMEYMLSEALPIYSGGLGNVAGDQLKAAGDLGVPVTAVGMLWQHGYFRQSIGPDGHQQALYPVNDTRQMPIEPLLDADGAPLRLAVQLPGLQIWLRGWQATVGLNRLLLLDTNDPANPPIARLIASELYGGDNEMRLRQELVLGIGGWRLLEAAGLRPDVLHLNDGHAAFAVLERARSHMARERVSFSVALNATRAGNLFTTHTPVEAGFDRFPPELVSKYLERYAEYELGISLQALLAMGRKQPQDPHEPFNMAYLATRGAGAVNAVSQLHGRTSRYIFRELYPRWPVESVPVGHVTNGIHLPTWVSPDAEAHWYELHGDEIPWRGTGESSVDELLAQVDDRWLWQIRQHARNELLGFVRSHLARSLAVHGASPAEIEVAGSRLHPERLTLGFARRFASYKRPNLLLQDPERLAAILTHPAYPVQLLVAGKAHPADRAGQALLSEWQRFAARADIAGRVVFLEDYDMRIARHMVQGVDVWLNTPRRPWEASGTSGMKVLANGGLNLSQLDGWWAEAYAADLGWAVGDGLEHEPEHDAADAEQLYRLLEEQVVPCFYRRDEQHIPTAWVKRMRRSMSELVERFSADRTVREYTERYYLPLASAYRQRCADGSALAIHTSRRITSLRSYWHELAFEQIEWQAEGDTYRIGARLHLGRIEPEQIAVQLLAESRGNEPATVHTLKLQHHEGAYASFRTELSTRRPVADYTARVVPSPELGLAVPLELPLILWQR
ncbi:alpha-glucan family phosphorylase [Pseudomonas songnenensis]|uniref:Alpha-glucan family phosphorylase n=1 Tax=Pseudomonas songnenensis TaxID=1176259 RepID=A0ABX9US16_9PSED|nr:alpha-glucan family phosphorylase [Pseudomonas songnenensis]MCQ4299603.1 alpha-glucan family phosphorylase [Pseudomonas songnenensis]RMH96019.1 alpha-glucan family phosphorylase [Pseudomonas songnenensis]